MQTHAVCSNEKKQKTPCHEPHLSKEKERKKKVRHDTRPPMPLSDAPLFFARRSIPFVVTVRGAAAARRDAKIAGVFCAAPPYSDVDRCWRYAAIAFGFISLVFAEGLTR